MIGLQRYRRPIGGGEVRELLRNPQSIDSEAIGLEWDDERFAEIVSRVPTPLMSKTDRSALDAAIVGPFHESLKDLPERLALDMRFWHWMCINPMRDFVWKRWFGAVPANTNDIEFTSAQAGRFVGSSSLTGVSRNALARLWWCGRALHTVPEGYALAQVALKKQDLFQAVYERAFGLHMPAARACFKLYENSPEVEFRAGTKRLNGIAGTVAIELLTEADVTELLA